MANVTDECYPIKTKTVKTKSLLKPWVNDNLKGMIKRRHVLLKKYLKMPRTYGNEYRELRNSVNRELKSAKENYYKNKLNVAVGNCKKKLAGNWRVAK